MKTKDLIHTLTAGLVAALLCLPLTTACTDDDPTGDGTENTDPSNPGGNEDGNKGEHDNGNGITYNDEDLTFDETANLYTIHTARGLWAWGLMNYGQPDASAVLAADITLGEYLPEGYTEDNNWYAQTVLTGDITFDGAGHTISGMRVEQNDNLGFFRCITEESQVINLTVEGNIRYPNTVLDMSRLYMGGIAAEVDGGSIRNCAFQGSIDASDIEENNSSYSIGISIGGIAGYASNNSAITGCTATGSFTACFSPEGNIMPDYNAVGGIVGYAPDLYSDEEISDCHTPVDCHVTGYFAGGIAGFADGTNINNCSSDAEVIGQSYAGGIVGSHANCYGCYTTDECRVSGKIAGGIAGEGEIMYGCYSYAHVTGVPDEEGRYSYAGGLAGYAHSDDMAGCYFGGTVLAPQIADHAVAYISTADGSTYIYGIYSTGQATKEEDGTQVPTNIYYNGIDGQKEDLPRTTDGQIDWETGTALLNASINEFNNDPYGGSVLKCEYHFVQTDGTSNPPTLAEGAPGAE